MNRKQRRDIKYGRKKANIRIAQEGVQPEALGEEEEGHVVVVTTMGLAYLVAGLRSIANESPEVVPLLETLEGALRSGAEERKAKAETAEATGTPVLVRPTVASVELVSESGMDAPGSLGADHPGEESDGTESQVDGSPQHD